MNTRRTLTKLSITMALVAMLATGAIWRISRVRASGGFEDQLTIGMIGITRGQTLRLNVVDLETASDGQLPPPCRVVLTFRDANGRPFTNSDGQVVRRTVELQVGQSAFLDLNGDIFAGSPSDTTGPVRLQLQPFVRVLSQPTDPTGHFPPPCRATMEVFDNASGRTAIFSAGFTSQP